MNLKNKKQLEKYFEKYKLQKFKKGETIFRPGDDFPGICYIKSGYVRLYTVGKDGQEVTIQLFKPVFYLSLIRALSKFESKYFFEAITPVEMWIAPKEEAMTFLRGNKEIVDEITKDVLGGFMNLISDIEYLISGNAYTKVARVIHSLATRHGEAKGNELVVKFNTPHRVIASMTGLTRETVTLQILKLEKEKIVDNKGKILYVKNIKKLEEAAQI